MIDATSWMAIYPEVLLLVMACAIALLDLFVTSPQRTLTYVVTLATLGVVALMHAFQASHRKPLSTTCWWAGSVPAMCW